MQPVNETACAVHLGNVQWYDPLNLLALTMLVILMVVVIIGNLLVIGAVLCTSKLRSVTNFFIVSLAVADLLVGVAVLPFSSIREVYKVSRKCIMDVFNRTRRKLMPLTTGAKIAN